MGVPGTSCAYGPRPQVRGSHSLLNTTHLLNLRQMSGELLIAHRSPCFTLLFATVALEGFKGKRLPRHLLLMTEECFLRENRPCKVFCCYLERYFEQAAKSGQRCFLWLACHGRASSSFIMSHPTRGFWRPGREGHSQSFPGSFARSPINSI